MKKDRIIKLCMTICLILGISVMPINQLEVKANEIIATVQGTISSGTTSDLLRLSTPQGNMEIKLDSDTDASACKILLPGKKISVSGTLMSANLISAVHDLVLESGLGAKNIAAAVGKPYSTLLREVNPFDDGAKLGAETLVDIMRVTGNIQPLEHIAEQFGYELKRTH